MRTKTGIMLGLGATRDEVMEAMDDLLEAGVHIITLGQYLQPTQKQHPLIDYIHSVQFAELKEDGMEKGFRYVESGTMVRYSYHPKRQLFDFTLTFKLVSCFYIATLN